MDGAFVTKLNTVQRAVHNLITVLIELTVSTVCDSLFTKLPIPSLPFHFFIVTKSCTTSSSRDLPMLHAVRLSEAGSFGFAAICCWIPRSVSFLQTATTAQSITYPQPSSLWRPSFISHCSFSRRSRTGAPAMCSHSA